MIGEELMNENHNQGGGGGGKGKKNKKKNKAPQAKGITPEQEADVLKKIEEENKNMEAEIDKIKNEWEAEKTKLGEKKDQLQKRCTQV